MSGVLQSNKISYQCSCGQWRILPELYFCRHCFKLKCDHCACREVDILFCPRCLEVSSVPEARLKKNKCFNCNDCPICANVLSARIENEKCYLICQYCRWSTRNIGQEDRENTKKWPVHENPIDDHLNEVMVYMKKLEVTENTPKDLKNRKNSKAWSALHLKDKFGVQQMVEKRLKMLMPEMQQLEPYAPSDPVSIENEQHLWTNSGEFRSLDEIIMQPLAAPSDPLFPIRVSLQGRTVIRCDECERTLIKRDFGVATYKFKIATFAREYVPDVRISRPVELIPGKPSHVLLSITNLSLSPLKMTIAPQSGEGLIECSNEPMDITLPSTKDSDSNSSAGVPSEKNEMVVFRQHNRIGLRFDVISNQESTSVASAVLGLNIIYSQDGSFGLMAATEKSQNPEETGVDRPLFANIKISLT